VNVLECFVRVTDSPTVEKDLRRTRGLSSPSLTGTNKDWEPRPIQSAAKADYPARQPDSISMKDGSFVEDAVASVSSKIMRRS